MSGTPGHVTRKDGRIGELPDRVNKIFKWLTIIAYAVPVIMLLVALADTQASLGPVWGSILAILPVGVILGALVGILRKGLEGNIVFGLGLIGMHWFAYVVAPATDGFGEMLFTRMIPIIGVVVLLSFLKQDLHYNLRPLWYSLSAMRDFQEMMAKAQARKDAKKRGEDFDESQFGSGKVIDVEAAVRAYEEKTGQALPSHMKGFTAKPGFRQESKKKKSGGGGKRKRK